MKTTENISLAGYAFIIESDAYDELRSYLETVRQSFDENESADEIVSDIEERIAELMAEKCRPGMVVNMSMVNEIEKRIGNPDELGQEDSRQESGSDVKKSPKKRILDRRLYRDMDERILGGVCSGLGVYFNIDKVLFRIAFIIAFFIGFADKGLFSISVIVYLVLWIAAPAARSVEQKCKMKGKPINLESYHSKEFDARKEIRDAAYSPAAKTLARICGAGLGMILTVIGLCGLFCGMLIPVLPSITEKLLIDFACPVSGLVTNTQFWILLITVAGLIFVWMLYNGIMLLFDLKSPSWRPGLIIFIAWMISLLTLAGYSLRVIMESMPDLALNLMS